VAAVTGFSDSADAVEGAMQMSGRRPSPVGAAEAAAESAVVVGR
jgi:hypothetical protein